MKQIKLIVTIEVEDDYTIDEPQWALEDAMRNGNIVGCNCYSEHADDEGIREDIRGVCPRTDCLWNDSGKCDMWDEPDIPENVNECDNYERMT